MQNKEMKKIYDQYFKCGSCDSVYHVVMLNLPLHDCKDCGNQNDVPKEAQDKSKKARK